MPALTITTTTTTTVEVCAWCRRPAKVRYGDTDGCGLLGAFTQFGDGAVCRRRGQWRVHQAVTDPVTRLVLDLLVHAEETQCDCECRPCRCDAVGNHYRRQVRAIVRKFDSRSYAEIIAAQGDVP